MSFGWRRGFAFFTALIFGSQTVLWSAPPAGREVAAVPLIEQISIPDSLGRIDFKSLPPGADRIDFSTLLHIQDAHSSYEGQIKIKEILKYLEESYGFSLIFLEGAEGRLNPDTLRFFNDDALNYKVADNLAREALVGGAELFLIERGARADAGPRAYGVEDKKLYWENLLRFRQVTAQRDIAEEFLAQVKSGLSTAGSHHFNPALRSFLKEWLLYQDSRSELLRHVDGLEKTAKKELGLDLSDVSNQRDWPNLVRLLKIRAAEAKKDLKKAEKEKQLLFDLLREKKIEKKWIDGLEALDLSARKGRPGTAPLGTVKEPRKFLERFYERAASFDFQFKDFQNFFLPLAAFILQEEIQAGDFLKETERLTDLILQKLARTQEEKALVLLFNKYFLERKLFSLELTRGEFEQAEKGGEGYQPSRFAAELEPLMNRRGERPFTRLAEMDEIFEQAVSFYKGTLARDEAMAQNVLRLMKEAGESKAVLVTGGFHSEGLAERMKSREIAYAEIMPRISDVGERSDYLEAIMAPLDLPSPGKSKIKSALFMRDTNFDPRGALAVLKEKGIKPRDLEIPAEEMISRFGDDSDALLNLLEFEVMLYQEFKKIDLISETLGNEPFTESLRRLIELSTRSGETGLKLTSDDGQNYYLYGTAMNATRLSVKIPMKLVPVQAEAAKPAFEARSLEIQPTPSPARAELRSVFDQIISKAKEAGFSFTHVNHLLDLHEMILNDNLPATSRKDEEDREQLKKIIADAGGNPNDPTWIREIRLTIQPEVIKERKADEFVNEAKNIAKLISDFVEGKPGDQKYVKTVSSLVQLGTKVIPALGAEIEKYQERDEAKIVQRLEGLLNILRSESRSTDDLDPLWDFSATGAAEKISQPSSYVPAGLWRQFLPKDAAETFSPESREARETAQTYFPVNAVKNNIRNGYLFRDIHRYRETGSLYKNMWIAGGGDDDGEDESLIFQNAGEGRIMEAVLAYGVLMAEKAIQKRIKYFRFSAEKFPSSLKAIVEGADSVTEKIEKVKNLLSEIIRTTLYDIISEAAEEKEETFAQTSAQSARPYLLYLLYKSEGYVFGFNWSNRMENIFTSLFASSHWRGLPYASGIPGNRGSDVWGPVILALESRSELRTREIEEALDKAANDLSNLDFQVLERIASLADAEDPAAWIEALQGETALRREAVRKLEIQFTDVFFAYLDDLFSERVSKEEHELFGVVHALLRPLTSAKEAARLAAIKEPATLQSSIFKQGVRWVRVNRSQIEEVVRIFADETLIDKYHQSLMAGVPIKVLYYPDSDNIQGFYEQGGREVGLFTPKGQTMEGGMKSVAELRLPEGDYVIAEDDGLIGIWHFLQHRQFRQQYPDDNHPIHSAEIGYDTLKEMLARRSESRTQDNEYNEDLPQGENVEEAYAPHQLVTRREDGTFAVNMNPHIGRFDTHLIFDTYPSEKAALHEASQLLGLGVTSKGVQGETPSAIPLRLRLSADPVQVPVFVDILPFDVDMLKVTVFDTGEAAESQSNFIERGQSLAIGRDPSETLKIELQNKGVYKGVSRTHLLIFFNKSGIFLRGVGRGGAQFVARSESRSVVDQIISKTKEAGFSATHVAYLLELREMILTEKSPTMVGYAVRDLGRLQQIIADAGGDPNDLYWIRLIRLVITPDVIKEKGLDEVENIVGRINELLNDFVTHKPGDQKHAEAASTLLRIGKEAIAAVEAEIEKYQERGEEKIVQRLQGLLNILRSEARMDLSTRKKILEFLETGFTEKVQADVRAALRGEKLSQEKVGDAIKTIDAEIASAESEKERAFRQAKEIASDEGSKSAQWFTEDVGYVYSGYTANLQILRAALDSLLKRTLRSESRSNFGNVENELPEVVFYRNNMQFERSQDKSPLGTMIASPAAVRFDLQHLPNAQGNLTITDRATNRRSYTPGKDEPSTSDTKIIREKYLPFSLAMSRTLQDKPGSQPLTWLDFSNNFGNPNHVSYVRGRLFYPTGLGLAEKFEQNLARPLFSLIQHPDGRIEFGFVHYEVTASRRIDGYYDEVHARALLKEEILPPDAVIFSAIPLIVDGKPADLRSAIRDGMFQDLRHLFSLPPAKHPDNVKAGDFGISAVSNEIRAGIFFGLEELAANHYEKAAQALDGPVSLPFTLSLTPDEKISLTTEQVKGLLAANGYAEETDPAKRTSRQPEEGKYVFVSDQEIVIYLKPNPYPHLLVGETHDGQIFIQSIGGSSGKVGITIKETLRYAETLGLKNLMTISQGTGSLIGYLPENVSQEPSDLEQNYRVLVGASEGRQAGSAVITVVTTPPRSESRTDAIDLQDLPIQGFLMSRGRLEGTEDPFLLPGIEDYARLRYFSFEVNGRQREWVFPNGASRQALTDILNRSKVFDQEEVITVNAGYQLRSESRSAVAEAETQAERGTKEILQEAEKRIEKVIEEYNPDVEMETVVKVTNELYYSILPAEIPLEVLTNDDYRALLALLGVIKPAVSPEIQLSDNQQAALAALLTPSKTFGLSIVRSTNDLDIADLAIVGQTLSRHTNKIQLIVVEGADAAKLAQLNQYAAENFEGRILVAGMNGTGDEGYRQTLEDIFSGERKRFELFPRLLSIANVLSRGETALNKKVSLEELLSQYTTVAGAPEAIFDNVSDLSPIKRLHGRLFETELLKSALEGHDASTQFAVVSSASLVFTGILDPKDVDERSKHALLKDANLNFSNKKQFTATLAPKPTFIQALVQFVQAVQELAVAA